MSTVFKILQKLVKAKAATGFESSRATVIKEIVAPLVDEVMIDTMGNLIAHKRGSGKKIMIAAHMDTIGFIITDIDDLGYLSFDMLGGHFATELINTYVVFENGTVGVIRPRKINQMKDRAQLATLEISDLYIDLGAKNSEEVIKKVQIGDYCVFYGEPQMAMGGNMISPYCDDLAGCAVLIKALEQIKECNNDLYFVFTVQEESGTRGAVTAAFCINPYMAIAVDVCNSDDMPQAKQKLNIALGKGPAIKIKDARFFANPKVVEVLKAAADREKIPYQLEIGSFGSTDASAAQLSHSGVYAGVISIPNRYMHSPVEIVNIQDVEQCAKLLSASVNMNI